MGFYGELDTDFIEMQRREASDLVDKKVEAVKANTGWGERLLDEATRLIHAQVQSAIWHEVVNYTEYTGSPIVGLAMTAMRVEGAALQYRGPRSTSATSNLNEAIEHEARLDWLNDVRRASLRYQGQYVSWADLVAAEATQRKAEREAEQAEALRVKAEREEQYGTLVSKDGKKLTHQGVRAVLKKAEGVEVVRAEQYGTSVQASGNHVLVVTERWTAVWIAFTDEELAERGLVKDGEGNWVWKDTGWAAGSYDLGEFKSDPAQVAALEVERDAAKAALVAAGYVVNDVEDKGDRRRAFKVTGFAA